MRLLLMMVTILLIPAFASGAAAADKNQAGRSTGAPAAGATPAPPPPPADDVPGNLPALPGEGLEPEVTITTRGTEIHEEHRVNGRLYRVKVIPKQGPPYYLIYDELGKSRRSDLEPDIAVPNWVIKRF